MKRISLFLAFITLLMLLASCNAVSQTDPEKSNSDYPASLEEGGFDIGEKDVSTTMNKRIIDFDINDIKLVDELQTSAGIIPADFVEAEISFREAPETQTLSTDSTRITLVHQKQTMGARGYYQYFWANLIDEYIDPETNKLYYFSNRTGNLVAYDTNLMEKSSTVKYRTYDDFLQAALTAAADFADLSKWDFDVYIKDASPYKAEEADIIKVFYFKRGYFGLETTESVTSIVRGDGSISCYSHNIGMFDNVPPIDLDLFKLFTLAEEKLRSHFDYINSDPLYNVTDVRVKDEVSAFHVNEQGKLEFHFAIEYWIEYFKEDLPEPARMYRTKRMYIVLD